jgi:hypothetical protein
VTIRTALRQPWTVVLLTLALAGAPFALTACAGGGGGGGGGQDAEALLDRAFDESVESADLDIDLQLDLEGLAGLDDPIRVGATGPYVADDGTLPKLDLDVVLETQGAGQAVEAGVLSTGDRVFLKFGGAFYEQPADEVARANRRLERDGRGGGSLAGLGLEPRDWIVDARVDGEEEIGGVATEHVVGTLDAEAALTDLNGLLKRSAGALGDAAGERARPLRPREVERLASSVRNATFDVYVGKDDDVLRRVAMRIDVDVAERDRAGLGGVERASIRFSAQLADIGGDQRVEAPRESRPLSVLTSQIGSLRALAGGVLGERGGDGGPATQGDPAAGLDGFEGYAECLDAADPNDAAAIAGCRALLP